MPWTPDQRGITIPKFNTIWLKIVHANSSPHGLFGIEGNVYLTLVWVKYLVIIWIEICLNVLLFSHTYFVSHTYNDCRRRMRSWINGFEFKSWCKVRESREAWGPCVASVSLSRGISHLHRAPTTNGNLSNYATPRTYFIFVLKKG